MSCDHYPPFGICTGHGICFNENDNGKCKCDDGWSSIGDFSTQEGHHCGINIATIRALYIIAIIPFMILFVLSFVLVKNRLQNNQQHQQQKSSSVDPNSNNNNNSTRRSRSSYRSSRWKTPVAIFPILFLLHSLCGIAFAILRIVDPIKYSIALNPLSTALLYFFCVFAVIGGCVYLLLLINFMDGYAMMMSSKSGQRIRNQSKVMRFVAYGIMIYVPLSNLTLFYSVINPERDRETMIAYAIVMILLFAFLGLPMLRYLSIMSKEIKIFLDNNIINDPNNNNNNENIEKFVSTKNKVDKAWFAMLSTAIFSTTQYLIFIFVPFVSKMASYLCPFMLMPIGILNIMFNISVMNQTKTKTSEKKNTTAMSGANAGNKSASTSNNNAVIMPFVTPGNSAEIPKPSQIYSDTEATEYHS